VGERIIMVNRDFVETVKLTLLMWKTQKQTMLG